MDSNNTVMTLWTEKREFIASTLRFAVSQIQYKIWLHSCFCTDNSVKKLIIYFIWALFQQNNLMISDENFLTIQAANSFW